MEFRDVVARSASSRRNGMGMDSLTTVCVLLQHIYPTRYYMAVGRDGCITFSRDVDVAGEI